VRLRRTRIAYFLGCGLLTIGCDSVETPPGIDEWFLSSEPSLEIGLMDGDEPYQFHDVVGVVRFPDGRIVIGNAGTSELRVFDREGRHVVTTGGVGEGPGEFRRLSSIDITRSDSLVVFDSNTWRVSILDPSAEFVRSWSLESLGRGVFPNRVWALGDGSVMVGYLRGHMPGDPAGRIKWSAPAVRFSEDGAILNDVADVPGDEWFRWETDEGSTLMFLPFGAKGHLAVHDDRVYVGNGREVDLQVFGLDGQPRERIRVPIEPRPVTSADVRQFEVSELDMATDPARRARLHRAIPYPDSVPAYGALVIDGMGRIWVQEYHSSSETPARWWVIDQNGEVLSTVEMPVGFEPSWIDQGLVLGTLRDRLGVEYVRGYDLVIP
jgi:hypothetical protein